MKKVKQFIASIISATFIVSQALDSPYGSGLTLLASQGLGK